jgi:hypothetical protein
MKDGLLGVAKYLLPVLGGMVAGALASSVLSAQHETKLKSVEFRPQIIDVEPDKTSRPDNANLLNTLSARIQDLERRAAEKRPEESRAQPEPDAFELSDQEQGQVHQQEHRELLQMHQQEVRDPAWAREQSRSLSQDLAQVGERGAFKLLNVDCRTKLCTATVEWASRADAVKNYGTLLEPSREAAACAREIVLPDGSDNGPLRATAVFQCRGLGS